MGHDIHRHVKANKKYMTGYDKIKESSYLKYWGVNNLYRWAMSQKLPVDDSILAGNTSKFNKYFMKNCNEDRDTVIS